MTSAEPPHNLRRTNAEPPQRLPQKLGSTSAEALCSTSAEPRQHFRRRSPEHFRRTSKAPPKGLRRTSAEPLQNFHRTTIEPLYAEPLRSPRISAKLLQNLRRTPAEPPRSQRTLAHTCQKCKKNKHEKLDHIIVFTWYYHAIKNHRFCTRTSAERRYGPRVFLKRARNGPTSAAIPQTR